MSSMSDVTKINSSVALISTLNSQNTITPALFSMLFFKVLKLSSISVHQPVGFLSHEMLDSLGGALSPIKGIGGGDGALVGSLTGVGDVVGGIIVVLSSKVIQGLLAFSMNAPLQSFPFAEFPPLSS
jgi:hypothetical protein